MPPFFIDVDETIIEWAAYSFADKAGIGGPEGLTSLYIGRGITAKKSSRHSMIPLAPFSAIFRGYEKSPGAVGTKLPIMS
jgi:hypothetical protein